MPRYFYDTEFIEDGKTIDLISIGIVCEDGREYYAQSVEFDPLKANSWVQSNVLKRLSTCPRTQKTLMMDIAHHYNKGKCVDPGCLWRTREQIKNEILAFMDVAKYGKPELWAYYADYDHVVFCQLFGTMMDLPEGFPMYTLDLKQFCDMTGNPQLPKQGKGEHNALSDARWNKRVWDFLHGTSNHTARVLVSGENVCPTINI